MNSNELFETFLTYCKDYEIDNWGIVIKKGNESLHIMKPENPAENNYLLYQLTGTSREYGTFSDINEIIELCIDIFGEESIHKSYGFR